MSGEKPTRSVVRVRDVMRRELVFVDGMATAREAAGLLRREKVDALLVKKRHDDDEVGMVTLQDFITGVVVPERDPAMVNVYEIMTKPVLTVPAAMDVRYAVRLLVRAGVRRAPVEEQGALVGMLSLGALVLDGGLL